MQIMPFLSVCYVIAGLASLGLPGLSGFVAEMTIFVGSFEHTDTFHRVFTISSLVLRLWRYGGLYFAGCRQTFVRRCSKTNITRS